jgi:hypothetical protein
VEHLLDLLWLHCLRDNEVLNDSFISPFEAAVDATVGAVLSENEQNG